MENIYKKILIATCNYARFKRDGGTITSPKYEAYEDILFYIKRKLYEVQK